MGAIHDDQGRLLRDRWLVLDDGREGPERCVGRAYARELPVQLASDGTIHGLVLVDACWYGLEAGRLVASTSVAVPAGGAAAPELGLMGGLFAARAHGRPVPPPRMALRLPMATHPAVALSQPPAPTLPEPDFESLPNARPFAWESPDDVHLHGWHVVSGTHVPAFAQLRSFPVPVVVGRAVQPALLADVALTDDLGRLAVPLRVVVSGPNRAVRNELVRFVNQAASLVASAPQLVRPPAPRITDDVRHAAPRPAATR
jgi:hypothetical protein